MKLTIDHLRQMVREALAEKQKNPYAICTVSVGKTAGTQKRSEWSDAAEERYEKCKKDVEEE